MNARRARQDDYRRRLAEDWDEATRTGRLRRESMSVVEAEGVPEDVGTVVVDFVRMGRSAPAARRGLAERLWGRRRLRKPPSVMVVMPSGCLPLGAESSVDSIGWRRSSDLPPVPSRCDVCGLKLSAGAAWGALIDGPTFEEARFDEVVFACEKCGAASRSDLRPDRQRFLIEHGVTRDLSEGVR